ncbi:sterol desaturase family protein [Nocardioides sp. Kera G14]|uniref:sterol desaturase family protein n=1 Tax=Nocardioides sp. Kera G14 TaxID=2884264 RepID=UPI001D123B69|nr:sterol desaturase family protein [Nocardioides sp. Kera G14]UDY23531.1 sterol desaturase family protein [Nocardioides sp. Kera G14]
MHDFLDMWHNPVTYAIPFFLLTIAIELAALKWLDHDDNLTGYLYRDAKTSILMGLGSLVTTTVLKVGVFVVYSVLWTYVAPWQVPMTWWGILAGVVAVDFAYYWNHRFVHRARVGWAAHQAHHSSEYMNFATALRQKWNPWFEFFFFLPLPLLGFSPVSIYIAFSINLIFQFYVHTEMINKMWRPIELVFNTPSHHRVHHGSDPIYLDRNYAGIFIIWDRMFGTFQPELKRPTYGLTKPVTTYNLIKLQYGDYRALWTDVRNSSSVKEALGWIFGPPGWAPEGKTPTSSSTVAEREPEPTTVPVA